MRTFIHYGTAIGAALLLSLIRHINVQAMWLAIGAVLLSLFGGINMGWRASESSD